MIVFNAALNAFGKGKRWKLGMNLLSSMRHLGSLGMFFLVLVWCVDNLIYKLT